MSQAQEKLINQIVSSQGKKLSKPQQAMLDRLKSAPKQRLKTTKYNEVRTLEALKGMGLVVQLWGPTSRNPESLYALVNERRSY